MTIEMVVQGRVHHKLRPKPKPRAIRTLPRAAMASDREEKHRKHTKIYTTIVFFRYLQMEKQ